jgi:hypothetical protein
MRPWFCSLRELIFMFLTLAILAQARKLPALKTRIVKSLARG